MRMLLILLVLFTHTVAGAEEYEGKAQKLQYVTSCDYHVTLCLSFKKMAAKQSTVVAIAMYCESRYRYIHKKPE